MSQQFFDTDLIKKYRIKQFAEEQVPYSIFPKMHHVFESTNMSDIDSQTIFSGGREGEFYPTETHKTAERIMIWCKKKKIIIKENNSMTTRGIKDIIINAERIIFEFNNNKLILWDEKKGKWYYHNNLKKPIIIKEIYFTD